MDKKQECKFKEGDKVIAIGPDWFKTQIGTITSACEYYNHSGAPVCRIRFDNNRTDTLDQGWLRKLTKLQKAML